MARSPSTASKIDRSFVLSLNAKSESAAILTAITSLANSLNLAFTAEEIEHQLIEARLLTMGSFKGQGWYYGKPIPAADVPSCSATSACCQTRARKPRPSPSRGFGARADVVD